MDFQQFLLDLDNNKPRIHALADFIRQSIENGQIALGEKLPTERQIAEKTGFSRGTVRATLALLEKENYVQIRKGSGSYVQAPPPKDMVRIAIFGTCLETLIDLKTQLDYLDRAENHLFLLESLTMAPNPAQFLQQYDICLVPKHHLAQLLAMGEAVVSKLLPINTIAAEESFRQMIALDVNCRIGIICRSNEFLATVKGTLVTYGFSSDNILSFFEMDYTTATYFPGGIDALVSFSAAHVFTNHHFQFRNEEFLQKGGKMIPFVSVLDDGCMQALEKRIAAQRNLSV